MINNKTSFEELKKSLEQIKDNFTKIDFLENFLKNNLGISNAIKAQIYEGLAELNYRVGKPKGSLYQKAASFYEMLSSKSSLRRAFENYKKAIDVFQLENSKTLVQETQAKLEEIQSKIRISNIPFKTFLIAFLAIILISSIFFLSFFPLTGFAISPIKESDTALLVFFLAAISFLILLHLWFRIR
ncbi:hypothetical protein HYV50_00135 [Candidatus Pacearchaeota archaeon]|nr:hypothetical protein [Candidatus Pacearchaeota archaeon]